MKFVYVLVCQGADDYAVQCYLSIWSLRYHNPNAVIVLTIDQSTKNSLENQYPVLLKSVDEIKIIDVPKDYSVKSRSRFIKTSLRQNIQGDFLYIDSDTVVTGNLDELQNFNCDVAAVYDLNQDGTGNSFMSEKYHKIGIYDENKFTYFNGGVFLVKETSKAYDFFKDWHKLWLCNYEKHGIEIDQISLLQANYNNNNIIKELPGIYNCLIPYRQSIDYLFDAKILHYIAHCTLYSSFPLEDRSIINEVKTEGVTERVKDIILNPIKSFIRYNTLLGGETLKIYESHIVLLARKLSRDYPWTNKIARLIYKLGGYKI
ncbi:MAG: hypothetical protein J1E38_05150 [Paramuribaculum sp.]|nr:hypothetical protein [Paramuribaculum sp.]